MRVTKEFFEKNISYLLYFLDINKYKFLICVKRKGYLKGPYLPKKKTERA